MEMENGNEISSSSLSFDSYLSNGWSSSNNNHNNVPPAAAPRPVVVPPPSCQVEEAGLQGGSTATPPTSTHDLDEELSLVSKLSWSLKKLVDSPDDYDEYTDAEIEVDEGNVVIGVHRCILAARSPFLHQHFKKQQQRIKVEQGGGGGGAGKPRYLMSELVVGGAGGRWRGVQQQQQQQQQQLGYEAFMSVLNYLYTGKVVPCVEEVSTCVDESCAHDACGPAIQYAVQMMYISATFQITDLVLILQRHLLKYVDTAASAEDVIPILMVALHSDSNQLLSHCIHRIAHSDLHLFTIDKELPLEVATNIKQLRRANKQQHQQELDEEEDHHHHHRNSAAKERSIRSIHQALDSDDIELVKLLMAESNITLDAAYALHYAAAYCTGKILKELLNMGTADVNLKDPRGHTVLHVAARRKDASVIVELLHRGASVWLTTGDGRTALTICRRLTRPKDFNAVVKHGEEAHKDRLCIDMLAREMMGSKSVAAGTMSMSAAIMAAEDDLHMTLLLFENRVALARNLFPHEARLAMQIAEAEMTLEFAGLSASKGGKCGGNYLSRGEVKLLKEIPSEQVRKLQQRLHALLKTVETGRRFFPNCSHVLDSLLEDDTVGTLLLERGTPEERKRKRMRYMELKDEVLTAFNKDMKNNNNNYKLANISSSSSSPPPSSSSCSSSAKHKKVRKR